MKIILAGGPHTGKTTLFQALQQEFQDFDFIPEPAELVIKEQYDQAEKDPNYPGIFPWSNYEDFVPLVIDKSLELEDPKNRKHKRSIQDRSLIDSIAYGHINGLTAFIPALQKQIAAANYDFVFFCEPVGSYENNAIRAESPELAKKIHQALFEAYSQTKIPFQKMPEASLKERIQIFKSIL